jgi:aldehyde:ferredoxin oxidoreductase
MKTKKVTVEELSGDYSNLGGRALTSTIVAKEVPPTSHPLSAHNKLVIAAGLLSGSTAANAGRRSGGAKSPLTGGIKESNVGGNASPKLARLGYMGIVVSDQPEKGKLFILKVDKNGA